MKNEFKEFKLELFNLKKKLHNETLNKNEIDRVFYIAGRFYRELRGNNHESAGSIQSINKEKGNLQKGISKTF